MFTEQPGLFGEYNQSDQEENIMAEAKQLYYHEPFIPGVKLEEAYIDINNHDDLVELAKQCQKCRLRNTCRQVVFGEGDINTSLMFVGEGPGKDEDEQGKPFVGRAGQLLDKILQAAEIPREKVYITNVVKCRPPGNRLPNPDEFKICRNYLEAQIRIIQPQIIVCLGSMATQTVIDSKARITAVRGKWFQRQATKIIATYHPAALLRNADYKRPTWEDFKQIRDEYKRCRKE